MAENVGKQCECIFQFEKHYVDLGFSELIKRYQDELREIRAKRTQDGTVPELVRKALESSEQLMAQLLDDLDTVRQRFADMPTC